MKRFSILLLVASTLIWGCGKENSAIISGTVEYATDGQLLLNRLDVNKLTTVDTIKYDSNGYFKKKIEKSSKNPDFYYLFYNNRKVLSLALLPGDNISFTTDTLASKVTITGSHESSLLTDVEDQIKGWGKEFDSLITIMNRYQEVGMSGEAERLNYQLGAQFVKIKRDAIKRVVQNPSSITNIILFYHKLPTEIPLFGDLNDAPILRVAYDSLSVRYPSSPYLQSLYRDILDREKIRDFNSRLKEAEEIGFPEITLPDINSKMVSLSSLKGRVILLSIWSAAESSHRILNREYLDLYDKFPADKFEIFQVSLDIDKAVWATAVKEQMLPWVSVCDSKGGNSKVISSYNLEKLPANFIIDRAGDIVAKDIYGEDLKREISKLIKD